MSRVAESVLPTLDSALFYDQLVAELTERRDALSEAEKSFGGLCRQVADEGKHYKLLVSYLQSLGASMDSRQPEPELEWVEAHNITGELGAMNHFEGLLPRVPEATQQSLGKVILDVKFHVSLGRLAVQRFATTVDRQRRVNKRVWDAFELEQRGRLAFERRLRERRWRRASI